MTIYAFDIDGTICTNTYGKYEKAVPFKERIKGINFLYKKGHIIKLFTARGTTTSIDWEVITRKQLADWGLNYHELIFGKPEADFFIDDKSFNDCFWQWHHEYNEIDPSLLEISDFFKKATLSFNSLYQDEKLLKNINDVGNKISNIIKKGNKVLFAGNGGSFADAQHLAAEFICKLNKDRGPLPAIALGTNSSSSSAIANDYGFKYIFSREIEVIGSKGDYLIAISTSGESENIIELLKKAKSMGIITVIMTGPPKKNKSSELADFVINTPLICNDTAEIQQLHIAIGHYICNLSQSSFI